MAMAGHVLDRGRIEGHGGTPVGRMWPTMGASSEVTTRPMTPEERIRYGMGPAPSSEEADAEMGKHLDPDKRAQIEQMIRDGATDYQIAQQMGVSNATPWRIRQDMANGNLARAEGKQAAAQEPAAEKSAITGSDPGDESGEPKEASPRAIPPQSAESDAGAGLKAAMDEYSSHVAATREEGYRTGYAQGRADEREQHAAFTQPKAVTPEPMIMLTGSVPNRPRFVDALILATVTTASADVSPAHYERAQRVADWAAEELAR